MTQTFARVSKAEQNKNYIAKLKEEGKHDGYKRKRAAKMKLYRESKKKSKENEMTAKSRDVKIYICDETGENNLLPTRHMTLTIREACGMFNEEQETSGKDKTKTVNEQTVSPAKASNPLSKSSLLATVENENHSQEDDITQLKISQLRAQLRAHGLSPVGRKDALLQRLQNYLSLKAGKTITHKPYGIVQEVQSKANEATDEKSDSDTPTKLMPKAEDQSENTHIQYSSPEAIENKASAGHVKTNNERILDHSYIEPPVESVDNQAEGDVYVEYINGLPHLTVPLPSRLEKCRFALRPVSHKVGDLIEMLKIEDHGIDRAVVLNKCGVRIASTCSIDSLLDEPFWLYINDNKYEVIPPKRKKIDAEDLKRLSDVRTMVAQLYEALHVGEYHLYKEQELVKKIEDLKFEIAPLEMEKQELTKLAERKVVIATWVGLSLMAVQFGVLARLTWWEYSWDIMEPVTYFVTYGTTMAMYAYYCLTKSEYAFESIRNRLFLLSIHKKAEKKRFDIDKYNMLKRQIAEAEYDLRRLRDPINLQLPPHVDRAQRVTPIEPTSAGSNADAQRLVTTVSSEKKSALSFRLPFLEPKN